MIRVVQCISSPMMGGGERVFCELARGLDPTRFAVTAICPEDAAYLPLLRRGPCDVAAVFRGATRGGVCRLSRLLRRWRTQIVHTHLMDGDTVGIAAAMLARVPVIVATIHGYNYWAMHQKGWRRARYRIASLLYRLRYHPCAMVLAVSHAVKEDLVTRPGIRLPPSQVRVLHNAATVESTWEVVPSTPRPVVLMVANFWPVKGHRTLVEAMPAVVRDVPETAFWFVGDGPCRAAVERRIEALGMRGRVMFHEGRVELSLLLRQAWVVAVPSLLEGFGLVALDAAAAGRPVVASAVGGLPEVVRDGLTGLLVSPDRPDALAEALVRLLRNAPERQLMGTRARAWVEEHFTLAPWLNRTEELYTELLRHV